ncbi:hypothetical protein quinque_015497 [Culex quinquefasciatus]
MDEFALCWNNFADNIASGFQSLYDRGDLVDVTIACDGKLLKAHKIVLAICSPYFQEMFLENPCKHPIIVLKDVSLNVMQELLQFMYQGEVNVKHSELQSFMKIAETLQIKGLTASHRNDRNSSAAASPATNLHQPQPAHSSNNGNSLGRPSTSQLDPSKLNSYLAAAAKESLKRAAEFPPSSEQYPIHYPKKPLKRSTDSIDQESNSDCMDQLSSDEVFIPTSPQVSMIEPQAPSAAGSTPSRQFDLSSVKREHTNDSSCSPQHHHNLQQSPTNLATSAAAMGASAAAAAASMKLGFSSTPTHHHGHSTGIHPMFGAFDPSGASFSGIASSLASISGATAAAAGSGVKLDYSNSDYSQDFGKGGVPPGHMDIPAGPSITMLSSTSLLHHNCIFNRNNTVATQQGLKTYWLCKSYRVSMCRARCITHHGQVISSTGVHNHPPHMKGPHEFSQQPPAVPPVPPPPPAPPMTSGNHHHGPPNHPLHPEQQPHLNHPPPPQIPPAMVTSNGTYDHHDRMPPPPNHQHYQPGPMGPPHDLNQYPQHHYPMQDHYQPYPQVPAMVPPPPPHQMTQNGAPDMPSEVPDVKLIQLQPVPPMDSLGRSVASAIGGVESTTDSILLPPPPQPPSAAPAPDLQLKTEQIS